jgi:phosphoribosylamine---glycine ligase
VEIAIGAYFNGKSFIRPINVNFEHKRVFPGNIGPFTGEMGTLMFWTQNSPLFDQTLAKMEPTLSETGYVGYIDLNCIVNGRGIYPLEFTSRFGYPTIHIQCEGIQNSASEWLERLAKGDSFELKTKRGYQIGVRVLVPSHFSKTDNEDTEFYRDLAVNFRKANSLDGVHIEDVKCDNGIWRIAGSSGCVLVITASGSTVEETRRLVYSRIQNIMIPNMFYRTDIGTRWFEESDKLRTWGYL